jgi:hypothetical protein
MLFEHVQVLTKGVQYNEELEREKAKFIDHNDVITVNHFSDRLNSTSVLGFLKQIKHALPRYCFRLLPIEILVIYLQPLTPEAECSPFFIIENESRMAKIDEILEIAQSRI